MAMIETIMGEIDEAELDKHEGSLDNAIEYTVWTEYRLKGDGLDTPPIHRSVHVTLKEPIISDSFLGE